jgi:hypothetical protein
MIQLATVVGPIDLRVPSYQKTGKRSLRPVEAMLGPRKFVSPYLERRCAALCVELPYAAMEKEMRAFGAATVSRETARLITMALGNEARDLQIRLDVPPAFAEPESVTVFADGGRVSTTEGWREPRLARIELRNAMGLVFTVVLTRICSASDFWQLLQPLLEKLGARTCKTLAFVADGSDWILAEARRRFLNAILVLDFYHAAKHIHDAADLVFGKHTTRASTWARKYRRLIKRGSIVRAIYEIQEFQRTFSPASEAYAALESLIGYLEPRREQLRYAKFRRRRLPIGSGRIESLVKQGLNMRLRRTCVRWDRDNAERLLALRCMKVFGHFDAVWASAVARRVSRTPAQFHDLLCEGLPRALSHCELLSA